MEIIYVTLKSTTPNLHYRKIIKEFSVSGKVKVTVTLGQNPNLWCTDRQMKLRISGRIQ